MKGRKQFEIRWKRSGFPRFSQKGAGKSERQVQAGERFGAVSTDSQASSQQQGFMVLFFRIITLAEEVVAVDFAARGEMGRRIRGRQASGRSTFPQCRERRRFGTLRSSW